MVSEFSLAVTTRSGVVVLWQGYLFLKADLQSVKFCLCCYNLFYFWHFVQLCLERGLCQL